MTLLKTASSRTSPVVPTRTVLHPLETAQVRIDDGFWGERQQLNSDAIIPHAIEWMTRLGWVANLEAAGADARYEHRGREFAELARVVAKTDGGGSLCHLF